MGLVRQRSSEARHFVSSIGVHQNGEVSGLQPCLNGKFFAFRVGKILVSGNLLQN